MSYRIRKIVTVFERIIASTLGEILWPPSGSHAVCWTNSDKEELVILDTDNSYHFPGGLISTGEHPKTAAEREFKEETGLNADIGSLISIETFWNGIPGLHFFYEAELKDDLANKESGWEGESKAVKRSEMKTKLDKLYNSSISPEESK